jgi:hypothetical protein
MLTVETEANGDSWSANESGPSLVGSLGSSCPHCKDSIPKIRTNIPRKETEWLHSCFCERFMYIPLIGLPILQQENWWAERGNI